MLIYNSDVTCISRCLGLLLLLELKQIARISRSLRKNFVLVLSTVDSIVQQAERQLGSQNVQVQVPLESTLC